MGQNLWDKNDLFQTEKFGVKFESLEIDEFLNENGLNETDVEFLDNLQKIENLNSSSIVEPTNRIPDCTESNSSCFLTSHHSNAKQSNFTQKSDNKNQKLKLKQMLFSDSNISNFNEEMLIKRNQYNFQNELSLKNNKEGILFNYLIFYFINF